MPWHHSPSRNPVPDTYARQVARAVIEIRRPVVIGASYTHAFSLKIRDKVRQRLPRRLTHRLWIGTPVASFLYDWPACRLGHRDALHRIPIRPASAGDVTDHDVLQRPPPRHRNRHHRFLISFQRIVHLDHSISD